MTEDQLLNTQCYICHSRFGLSLLQNGLFKCKDCKVRESKSPIKVSAEIVKSTPSWRQRAKENLIRISQRADNV